MITAFFFIGGAAATLIRLELISPHGHFLTDDEYNHVFTLHGIIMVWFFLVPLIPTTFGNFLLPLMIGAPDVAFPKLNLMSWYLTLIGGICVLAALLMGGRRYGLDLLPALFDRLLEQQCRRRGHRRHHRGIRHDRDRRRISSRPPTRCARPA